MIIHPDFRHHWKTRSLVSKLKDHAAPLYVIELWAHCQRQRTTYFEMTDEQLKDVCMVEGSPGISENPRILREALEACGFIVASPDKPMGFAVHEWEQHNRSLINSWANGQKGGRRKESTGYPRKPAGNPPKSISISNSLGVQNKNKVGNPWVSEPEPTLSEEKASLKNPRTESDEAPPDPETQAKAAEFLKELSRKLRSGEPIQ